MSEFYMGNELTQQNWPPNAPRPRNTPVEGVLLTETDGLGITRRILYTAIDGDGVDTVISTTTGGMPTLGLGEINSPALRPFENPPREIEVPIFRGDAAGQSLGMPAPRPFDAPPIPEHVYVMGQTAPTTPEKPSSCPTSIEMPDGRILKPDDAITVKDLCALMPALQEAMQGTTGGLKTNTGGAMFSGGGGGAGTPGAQGPQGLPGMDGAEGPEGPIGLGMSVEFVVKTDGDFATGPGAFVAVPGTSISFTSTSDGPALFNLQAVLGCSFPNSAQLGLRIDGTDYPLARRTIHTFADDVQEFYIGQTCHWPIDLLAGAHTAEVILRGLAMSEGCEDSGLGIDAQIQANEDVPLALSVQYRGSL